MEKKIHFFAKKENPPLSRSGISLIPFLICLIFISFGCSIRGSIWRSDVIAKKTPGIEKKISFKDGSFVLDDLKIIAPGDRTPTIFGTIINRTNKDWKNLQFEVVLKDDSGKIWKDQFAISVQKGGAFKNGDRQQIGLSYGTPLESIGKNLSNSQIEQWDVKFHSGEYLASYDVKLQKSTPPNSLTFVDQDIAVRFNISKEQIGFALSNKTTEPIKIDWDQVSYIDIDGESHKVIHSGIRLMDRANPQSPTIIPPSAKITDMVYPSGYVYYEKGRYGGWREMPIFPDAPSALKYKGQSFGVFLPIEVKGKVENYLFKFIIKDVST